MPYDANIHHRRSIRLKGYDYSQAGLYFVTICCDDRQHRFGKIENGEMRLNEYGTIAYNEWAKLPERFPHFQLDVFQIMPNHMHAIIALNVRAGFTPAQNNEPVGAGFTPAQNDGARNEGGQPQGIAPTEITPTGVTPTVGEIVGAYKSLVANGCLDIWRLKWAGMNPSPTMGKLWQRNYYEHIIRNETAYHTISTYIINNPVKWMNDKFYVA